MRIICNSNYNSWPERILVIAMPGMARRAQVTNIWQAAIAEVKQYRLPWWLSVGPSVFHNIFSDMHMKSEEAGNVVPCRQTLFNTASSDVDTSPSVFDFLSIPQSHLTL